MARILEWFPRPFQKASVMVEQDMSPVFLRALLWGYKSNLPALANSSPLTTTALVLWYRRGLREILSSDPSPLSPLFDNPAFPQGIGAYALDSFRRTSLPQAHSFIHADNGTPNIPTGNQDWLTSLHLTTFTKHLFGSSQIHRPLTEFEHISSLQELPRHLLSHIYSLIQALTQNDLPTYTRMWSADLGKTISRAEWQTAFHFAHKSSISCYSQEKNFKVMSRWYRDPATLQKIFPSTPSTCWRCSTATGSYLHVWWECDRI